MELTTGSAKKKRAKHKVISVFFESKAALWIFRRSAPHANRPVYSHTKWTKEFSIWWRYWDSTDRERARGRERKKGRQR